MNGARKVRTVFLWNARSSRKGNKCVKMVIKSNLETSWDFHGFEKRDIEISGV